ncbi:Uncharacterised protein [Mycobacteroides abscessus subsp. abscessus]|nr:Uncharacterised protein [Mycobacteroides abscessus subsp. abscessus]
MRACTGRAPTSSSTAPITTATPTGTSTPSGHTGKKSAP